MLNLTQHNITKEQEKEGVVEPKNKDYVCSLLTFDTMPTEDQLKESARKLAEYALFQKEKKVMIGGAMYLMPYLIDELNKRGIEAYYSFSERQSVDKQLEDGTVEKNTIFKHCGFVKALLPDGKDG